MIRLLPLLLAAAVTTPLAAQSPDPHLERVKRILDETPLIDGHNDLPWTIRRDGEPRLDVEAYDLRRRTPGHTDLARLREGKVGAQFWSVYIPGEIPDSGYARVQLEEIDIARRVIDKYPDHLALARSASDIERIFGSGKVASLLGMEGGHAIENSLGALRAYFELGVRYMTLTHNVTLDWADAALDEARHGGLTRFGEEVVREMNRLGMLVDLSHVSPATMSDALNVAEAPVIYSHSSSRELADHARNVPDSILRRLPDNGGVVMVTFVTFFISQERIDHNDRIQRHREELERRYRGDEASLAREMRRWHAQNPPPAVHLRQVADHIEHIRQVAGIDHVGIGSDFDGIDELIVGLEDVSTFPALFAELSRRGWSDADLRKLAGENLLRALREAERAARKLQRERPPSTATIDELDGTTSM